MGPGIDRGVILGIVLLAGLTVGIAATSFVNTRHLRDDAARATQSRMLLDAIGAIRTDTRAVQAAQRAYLITGFPDRVAPYREAAADLRAGAARLADRTAGDPPQHERALAAGREIESGIAGLDAVVDLRARPTGLADVVALAKERGSRSFVDPLLETLGEMERSERERLAQREAETRDAYDRAVGSGAVAALMSLAALGLFVRVLRQSVRSRAEDAARLADQRELLDATLTSIGDAVIATDARGAVTFLNVVAQDLTGWAAADARGRPLDDVFRIVNESTRAPVENPALRALKEGVIVGLANHTVLIAKDGTERAIDDSAAPIRSGGGISGAVLVFRDISDRKRAEASLRASEERYRVLVTATSDVVYRMSPDWAEMHPLDGRDLVASNAEPIRDWMHKNIPASEHARVREAIDRAVADGKPFELEHQVARADGTAGWTFSRAAPIRNAAGAVVEWFGTARDVTPQKRAEDDLARVTAESERQRRLYETILSATPDFVYVFSLDHRVLYANESLIAMWGRGRDGAIGKTFLEIGYPAWHAEMHDGEIDQVKATGRPIRGEVPFEGTLGRRTYDYIFVPVFAADGEVEAVAGTTRDVTERQRAEAALRDADRKKDDFIALLAHELRNPLAPLRNGLQVVRLSDDRAMRDRAQQMMERQLAHMVRMIDDLLDVSRIGRHKMELRRARVSLADVVSSAVETARPAIDDAGHELTVTLPAGPVFLDADLTRLSQVFSNLLTNSAKYTPRGGRVWLTAGAGDGGAVVAVRDTGLGIPADALPNIFDMFSQVDRPTERAAGGLGIGLALVRGLVEMHGGTVTARSEGQGRGSTFTVTLPALAGAEAGAVPAEPPRPAGKRRILVVDDNADGAESLAMMLDLKGNEVETAHDGLDAVEKAERFRPDVILMDVGMPKLDGLAATRRIREQPWGRPMTIIALTGWGQDGDRERSRGAGCDGHIVKPVDPADLEKLLAELRGPS